MSMASRTAALVLTALLVSGCAAENNANDSAQTSSESTRSESKTTAKATPEPSESAGAGEPAESTGSADSSRPPESTDSLPEGDQGDLDPEQVPESAQAEEQPLLGLDDSDEARQMIMSGDTEEIVASMPAEGTQTWGDDGCLWRVVNGYWMRDWMCRVASADGDPHTWFTYAAGTDPASQWVHQVDESPEVTGNGQYLVWFPRGGTNWMRCPTTTCDGASIEVAGADGTWYTSDQWAGITQLQSLVTQYNLAVQQAQQAGQQSNQVSAPQIIGAQGGSKDDWIAIINEQGGTNEAATNIARNWTAPACAASYNGC